jgi:hypothetical protein
MLSSSLALPGPMRAPDSKTMLTLNRAMTGTVPRPPVQNRDSFFPAASPTPSATSDEVNLEV